MTAEEMKALEQRMAKLENIEAARRERDKHVDKEFEAIKEGVKEIQTTLSKSAWLLISTVVTLSVTGALLVVSGVLTVGQ